ncbi:MAG: phenylalanine--tRNA ligase subunit beta [Bacilli bacterium]|nr:phenylalanine--tRNA ligase subunit beta [Bacilli bacterium]
MRVNMSWLKEFINLKDTNYQELANKMLLIGNEYDDITKISDSSNLVVGYVTERTNHPYSDHLNLCQVDIGDGEVKEIICGAANVDKGQKVIVAKMGATLPNGVKIGKAKIRGVESNGMICSLEELGIELKYIPERSRGGIHVLEDDAPIGMDALEYLHYNDMVINFDITANRSDLLSMLGMAYEIGAILKEKVKLPTMVLKEENEEAKDNLAVEIKTDYAPVYLTRIIKDLVIKESPNFIKARLMSAGIRSINNVVDISNYIMLEYGQPLHFFDYDKLGSKIVVRMANEGEAIKTLDNKERTLTKDDIVIATPKEAVGIAGVMGGHNTEVTNDTNSIVIESAVFDPSHIQATSKKILRSEASMRFAKGIDPNRAELALNRAAYLLQKYASGKVLKGIIGYNNGNQEPIIIDIALTKINRVLGIELKDEDVKDVFERLDFEYQYQNDVFKVTVPTRRLDIKIEEDLIEEIGRIYGYDQIPGILPITKIKKGNIGHQNDILKKLRKRLEGLGLTEVRTYSLINENNINKWTNDQFEAIKIKSPMSEEHMFLRYSIIPSLMDVANYNTARSINDIMIYEIGTSYYKKEENYIEEPKLAILMLGTYATHGWQNKGIVADFYVLKGILTNIMTYFGLIDQLEIKTGSDIKEMHPQRKASIYINNELIGNMGAVHPGISDLPIYLLEISLTRILKQEIKKIRYEPVSVYPVISKDLAWIFNKDVETELITKTIKKVGGELLQQIEVFDVYEGPSIGENNKSIAYTLTFIDKTKTLTEEIVNEIVNDIVKTIETELNGSLRDS